MFFRRAVFYRSRFGVRVWRAGVVVVCFLVVASLLPVGGGDSVWSYGLEIIFAGTSVNPQAVQRSAYFPSGGFRVRVSDSSHLDLGCQTNGFFANLVSEARNLVFRCAGSLPTSFKTALDRTARADFVFIGSEPATSTTTTSTTTTRVPASTTTTAVPSGPSAPVDPAPVEPAPAVPVLPVVEPADTVVPTASGELGGYLLPLPVGAYFGLTQSSSDNSSRSFNSSFTCSAEQSCYSISLALSSSGQVYTAELRLALNGDPGANRSRIALGDWHFIRHNIAPLKLVYRDPSFFKDDTASNDSYVRPQGGNDTIFGGPGEDEVYGGEGDDVIDGGSEADQLFGEAGNDMIEGGQGSDIIGGGRGDDILKGGPGDDTIRGNSGADTITAGAGNDAILGISVEDTVTDDA